MTEIITLTLQILILIVISTNFYMDIKQHKNYTKRIDLINDDIVRIDTNFNTLYDAVSKQGERLSKLDDLDINGRINHLETLKEIELHPDRFDMSGKRIDLNLIDPGDIVQYPKQAREEHYTIKRCDVWV